MSDDYKCLVEDEAYAYTGGITNFWEIEAFFNSFQGWMEVCTKLQGAAYLTPLENEELSQEFHDLCDQARARAVLASEGI